MREYLLEILPLLAYIGYWLFGAVFGAFVVGDPRILKLGVVTAPALLFMAAAACKVWKGGRPS